MLAGIMACLSGCAAAPAKSSLASGQRMSLSDPNVLAEYVQNEPSVRQVTRWNNPYGDGLVIDTANYRIYTTYMEPLTLRQLPSFLESAFRAYQSQLPQPLENTQPSIVYLFADRQQWEAFTRDTTGPEAEVYLKIQAGAYVTKGICVAYDIGRRQTFSVLGHEGWHQFNQRLFVYRLPSWLDEGIATLFETCRYEQGQFIFSPASNVMRLGTLKQTLLTGQTIPLDRLLLLNPGQILTGYNGDPDGTPTFYAQVYALVRFLREDNYGIRLRPYHAMLLGAAHGDWPLDQALLDAAADRRIALTVGWNIRVSRDLFVYYFGDDMSTMNAQYEAYCRKITYPVRLKQ